MIFFYKNFYPSLYYKTLLIAVQIFNVKDLRIMAIVNTDGHIYICFVQLSPHEMVQKKFIL